MRDELVVSLLSKGLLAREAKEESQSILDCFPQTINQAESIFPVVKRDCYDLQYDN